MSSRKGREKRSSSPEKIGNKKERKPKQSSAKRSDKKMKEKPKQSSTKHRDAKWKDKAGQSSKSHDRFDDEENGQSANTGLNDDVFGASSLRTPAYHSDDTCDVEGRARQGIAIEKKPPYGGFFDLPASAGSRETYAQKSPKEATEDPFAYIRQKTAALKSQKHKDSSTESDTSGGSESSGNSNSSGNSEKSEDSESNSDRDSTGDDSENSDSPKKSKLRSVTERDSGGTRPKKSTRKKNAGNNDRRDKSKMAKKEIDEKLPRELSRLSLTSEKYEWQFFDQRWITYGQANFAGIQPSETAFQSDDIEAFYRCRYPKQRHMLIANKYHTYKLDFKEMTQTNQSTSVKRDIRRVLKQVENSSSSLELYSNDDDLGSSKINAARVDSRHYPGNSPGTSHTRRFWQFEDDSRAWITYGQNSPAGGHGSGTTTSSDDIDNFRLRNPDVMMMAIQSSLHTYILDFKTMTQTNTKTSAKRKIRCVPFLALNANIPSVVSAQASGGHNSGGAFVWQFQDDNDAWITYGQASLAKKTFPTTATSDDIEQFYNVKRGSEPMLISNSLRQYVLDFQTMTQTNLETKFQRKIHRIPKHLIAI